MRSKIIDKASLAFAKEGIRNVHMDSIATSLGISKRTVYELFKDKECLLLEVLRLHHKEMNDYMTEVTSKADNVLEAIFIFYKRRSHELCDLNPLFYVISGVIPRSLNLFMQPNVLRMQWHHNISD